MKAGKEMQIFGLVGKKVEKVRMPNQSNKNLPI